MQQTDGWSLELGSQGSLEPGCSKRTTKTPAPLSPGHAPTVAPAGRPNPALLPGRSPWSVCSPLPSGSSLPDPRSALWLHRVPSLREYNLGAGGPTSPPGGAAGRTNPALLPGRSPQRRRRPTGLAALGLVLVVEANLQRAGHPAQLRDGDAASRSRRRSGTPAALAVGSATVRLRAEPPRGRLSVPCCSTLDTGRSWGTSAERARLPRVRPCAPACATGRSAGRRLQPGRPTAGGASPRPAVSAVPVLQHA
jgi:hypothetical protein